MDSIIMVIFRHRTLLRVGDYPPCVVVMLPSIRPQSPTHKMSTPNVKIPAKCKYCLVCIIFGVSAHSLPT